jgi:hypothetical protein
MRNFECKPPKKISVFRNRLVDNQELSEAFDVSELITVHDVVDLCRTKCKLTVNSQWDAESVKVALGNDAKSLILWTKEDGFRVPAGGMLYVLMRKLRETNGATKEELKGNYYFIAQ